MQSNLTKNQKYIIIAAILIALITGVVYFVASASASSVVAKGDTVEVYYTGTLTNGTQFGSNFGEQPFQFTVGANEVIPGFDQGVIGMRINQTKNITIPVNDAYGPINPSLIVEVPISNFGNQTVRIGETVTQVYEGQQVQGTVTAFTLKNVTVDFNPPLAGQTLNFKIKVVGIEKNNSTSSSKLP
jgi:peptidylprolyl isomerase